LGGTKFISFEEKHWHSDCFNCYKCNATLVGRGFLTDGDDILCPECGRA
jgi:LIM domain-containing protein 2